MQIPLAIGLLITAAALPLSSGQYIDSTGQVYNQLPNLSDFNSAGEFDARFATEVFTNHNGMQFQVDRPWTAEEEAYYGMLSGFINPNTKGSGNGLRANVTCTHPVDEEYRSAFGNVYNSIKNNVVTVVEMADNALQSNWGINFVPRKGYSWDSNDNGDIVQLLDEAYSEGGGLNGQDMMIAFSNDPTPGGAIGVGYIGWPRQLSTLYGNQLAQASIVQHEAGHNYTLQHCCDGNCIMQAYLDTGAFGGFHNYSENCSGQNHYSTMNSQRNRY
jgi:hypothetical protein